MDSREALSRLATLAQTYLLIGDEPYAGVYSGKLSVDGDSFAFKAPGVGNVAQGMAASAFIVRDEHSLVVSILRSDGSSVLTFLEDTSYVWPDGQLDFGSWADAVVSILQVRFERGMIIRRSTTELSLSVPVAKNAIVRTFTEGSVIPTFVAPAAHASGVEMFELVDHSRYNSTRRGARKFADDARRFFDDDRTHVVKTSIP